MQNLTKEQAIRELWRRGNLEFKCHSLQKLMRKEFYSAKPHSTLVWLYGRQGGKTFLISVLALEQALRERNSVIKVVTDTKTHMETIILPIMEELLSDCPEELKPHYHKAKATYVFPNGSQIQLAGSDAGHYEKLRGLACKLVLVDEAGFCDNLETIVKSVLLPTTTHTGGKIVLASTPPEDEEHDFLKFIEEAEQSNKLIKKTIDDNPLLSKEQVQVIEKAMGGRHTERFKREYLCEIIKNSNIVVIPEFTSEAEAECVKEWKRPPFFDSYVSMDLGGRDLTGALFAYYDFRKDKIIIEDEILIDFKQKDNNLKKFAEALDEKEKELYTNPLTNEIKRPYLRVSDIDYIVLDEIRRATNNVISFVPTKKDDKLTAVNSVRSLISLGKIVINPKCVHLIRHIKYAKWANNQKDKFARSQDNGHYDLLDALVYLCRSIIFNRNPYPKNFELSSKDLFDDHIPKSRANVDYVRNTSQKTMDVYKKIFGVPNKRNI